MRQVQSQQVSANANIVSDADAESFKRTVSTLMNSGDVYKALSSFASVNPQFRVVMQMCSGKDPRQIFYSECERRGIDPNKLASKLGLQ